MAKENGALKERLRRRQEVDWHKLTYDSIQNIIFSGDPDDHDHIMWLLRKMDLQAKKLRPDWFSGIRS